MSRLDRDASGQFAPISVLNPEATLEVSVLGSCRGGMYSDNNPADRSVYGPVTRRVFNGSGDREAADIIDISDPTHPATVGGIDVSAYGDEPQAVAIHKGILAVTVVTHDRPEIPGAILLFNVDGIPPGRSRSCARRPPATSPAPCSTSTAACT